MKNEDNARREYKVTAQGSLGLLALGAAGIKLWRDAVELEKQKKDTESKESSEEKQENGEEADK